MTIHTLLQGKKIMVTGAARGLGLGFAQAIAKATGWGRRRSAPGWS